MDTLAKRYGWLYTEISENMYWEDVYAMYEFASNVSAIERNSEMKFQFMLHAESQKALDSWRDPIAIPYPDRRWIPPQPKEVKISKSGLPPKLMRFQNKSVASPKQLKRAKAVADKMKAHRERVRADRFGSYRKD